MCVGILSSIISITDPPPGRLLNADTNNKQHRDGALDGYCPYIVVAVCTTQTYRHTCVRTICGEEFLGNPLRVADTLSQLAVTGTQPRQQMLTIHLQAHHTPYQTHTNQYPYNSHIVSVPGPGSPSSVCLS